jgi:hypothetical protein
MTTCPDAGAWRAWLDGLKPDATLEAHLDTCRCCDSTIVSLRANAEYAAASLRLLPAAAPPSLVEVAVAQRKVMRNREAIPIVAAPRGPLGRLTGLPTAWRVAASGVAAAVLLSLGLTVSPEGRALASQFLAQFRSQQVTAIELSPQSQAEIQRTMNTLGKLGLVRTPAGRRTGPDGPATTVGSIAEASQRVGFPLKLPDPASLPAELRAAPPRIQVMPADEVRFTFDKAKARTYFESTGHPEVTLPDRFDGATLVVSMPTAALIQYGAQGNALVLGQAGELAVGVESPGNVSLAELRDFLLGLPEIPPDTAAQLRAIGDWRTTLPIPIPTDRVHWQAVSIGGHSGLLLNDNSGVGSAAVWQADGHLYGLAGSLKATDLQSVAASLR